MNPWLGSRRGYLSDWATQQWVRLTGRRVRVEEHPWLDGLSGLTTGIGADFYGELARSTGLAVQPDAQGLMPSFSSLAGPQFNPAAIDSRIIHFYEQTSCYRLDAWSEWRSAFRPLAWVLAAIFSRRLQQLNLPLSPLETSRGITSRILALVDPKTGTTVHTGWVRDVRSTGRVAYVGDYATVTVPGFSGPCVRVVFPLPNGNATVILRPEAADDGSLRLHSSGTSFGDPGFYFVVRAGNDLTVRYLKTLREVLHVYVRDGELHTDHIFTVWGLRYLHLHYRLEPVQGQSDAGS